MSTNFNEPVINNLFPAHEILSLNLVADSHVFLQLLLWMLFPLLLIMFSVGFVQLVSIHAIGNQYVYTYLALFLNIFSALLVFMYFNDAYLIVTVL